ncbi:MAG: ribbon-helix-helix protein, CopG family [Dehalococcoidia bacterium]|jgi:hypothetical protein|nr:ribbon-helix-helix protein, CopG family [Dehalococcoidia bacterium]
MASRHLSIRIGDDVLKRLDAQSEASGRSRSELAKTFIEEGLRMEQHPGIVFRPGPTGRRPGLVAGPDVWELIRALQEVPASGDKAVAQVAKLTSLATAQVMVAVHYYADYQDEIDAWIERANEKSRLAEEAWHREQELLKR